MLITPAAATGRGGVGIMLNAHSTIVGGGPGRLAPFALPRWIPNTSGQTFRWSILPVNSTAYLVRPACGPRHVLFEMMKGGLVTLEKVRMIDYRANPKQEGPES